MLLANKTVAKHIGFPKKEAKPFVYRVHDLPDNDRIESLNNIVKKFGHAINAKNSNSLSISLNNLLKNVRGNPEQQMILQVLGGNTNGGSSSSTTTTVRPAAFIDRRRIIYMFIKIHSGEIWKFS